MNEAISEEAADVSLKDLANPALYEGFVILLEVLGQLVVEQQFPDLDLQLLEHADTDQLDIQHQGELRDEQQQVVDYFGWLGQSFLVDLLPGKRGL